MLTAQETQVSEMRTLTISEDWDESEVKSQFKQEPLLKHNPQRFVLFPKQ